MEIANDKSTPTLIEMVRQKETQKGQGAPSHQSSGRGSSVSEAPDCQMPEMPGTPEVFQTLPNTEYTREQMEAMVESQLEVAYEERKEEIKRIKQVEESLCI